MLCFHALACAVDYQNWNNSDKTDNEHNFMENCFLVTIGNLGPAFVKWSKQANLFGHISIWSVCT